MQFDQSAPLFRQNENAGGFLVQPVNEFQKPGIGPCGAQLFDNTIGNTGTAVDSYACGFVDDQNAVVFIQDVETGAGNVFFFPLGHLDGGNTNRIAFLQAVSLVDPLFVYANLTGTQNPVNMAFRDAFTGTKQEVIDPLSVIVFRYGDLPNLLK